MKFKFSVFSIKSLLSLVLAGSVFCFSFAMYLQHALQLHPCPMCITQRYALLGVMVLSTLCLVLYRVKWSLPIQILTLVVSCFGAFVAARQSWLQWNPPEFASCGRDFYGIIESYSFGRIFPMILKGTGDCSTVDWVFLGGTIANWSFIYFTISALCLVSVIFLMIKDKWTTKA